MIVDSRDFSLTGVVLKQAAKQKALWDQRVVTFTATILDMHHAPLKSRAALLSVKDAGRVTTAGRSEVAVPAGKGSSPLLPGGLGIILPALGPAREVLAGLGQARRG